ncbi:Transcription elongation factor GreB [Arsenophonus endosymbiont of Bemisia tabaci Q2]|nr:Transcription elongation factor GreB [Arsenophonus endosymbiont of Bemisia tabaci Q2]
MNLIRLKNGFLLINSLVARELLGKQIDDEVTVNTPNGIITYWILEINYQGIEL